MVVLGPEHDFLFKYTSTYCAIKEKEKAKEKEESDKYWAKIEDDMKTKKGEENNISEKESSMVSTMVVENEK